MKIELRRLNPSPFQTRSNMAGAALEELKRSFAKAGQAVPIKVRPINEHYEIVYGHRRAEAARQLSWKEIEAVVEELTDEQAMIQGLAENVQRDDLSQMDEARAYQMLRDDFGYSTRQIAAEVGKAQAWVVRLLSLLNEPDEVQEMIEEEDDEDSDAVGITDGEKEKYQLTEYHVREVRAVGLGRKWHVEVLHKAKSEELTAQQARRVAECVAVAEAGSTKRSLIDTEFSTYWHDPERVEADQQVEKEKKSRKSKQARYDQLPEVKWVLDLLKTWQNKFDDFDAALEEGKFAPEAARFTARKMRKFSERVEQSAETFEDWEE